MKRITAYLLALLVACTPALAAEDAFQLEQHMQLPPTVHRRCEDQGGCALITKSQFEAALRTAFEAGFQVGFDARKNST